MTSYTTITRQIGDQCVAVLKRAEDAVAHVEVPQVPVPEQVTRFNASVAGKLPNPSEILAANFELVERLYAAQKELALKLLSLAVSNGDGEGVAKSSDKTAASVPKVVK